MSIQRTTLIFFQHLPLLIKFTTNASSNQVSSYSGHKQMTNHLTLHSNNRAPSRPNGLLLKSLSILHRRSSFYHCAHVCFYLPLEKKRKRMVPWKKSASWLQKNDKELKLDIKKRGGRREMNCFSGKNDVARSAVSSVAVSLMFLT